MAKVTITEQAEEKLIHMVTKQLKADGYIQLTFVGKSHPQDAKLFRSLGRKAGKKLNWKVRTYQAPARDGYTLAYVEVIEADAEHEARWKAQTDERLRNISYGL